jgi:hypothetical protein
MLLAASIEDTVQIHVKEPVFDSTATASSITVSTANLPLVGNPDHRSVKK